MNKKTKEVVIGRHLRVKQSNAYTDEQLQWVADNIDKLPRAQLFADFKSTFNRVFTRNRLAGMMTNHGGSKAKFIEKNRSKFAEDKLGAAESALAAPLDALAVIAQALWDWREDRHNKNPYAYAAMRLNQAAGRSAINADGVEEQVRKAGGLKKLFADKLEVTPLAATDAERRIKAAG